MCASTSNSGDARSGRAVLGALAGRVSRPWEVARSDKALVEVNPGSLYFPILRGGVEMGGVFLGSGRFVVDAIVETKRGAYGESEESSWNGSLLLMASSVGDWSPPPVEPAGKKDLQSNYLGSVEEAQERAQQILERFGGDSTPRPGGLWCWCGWGAGVGLDAEWWPGVAFLGRRRGWRAVILDMYRGKTRLLAGGSRLVMERPGTKLVISGNRMVRVKGRRKVLVVGRHGFALRIP